MANSKSQREAEVWIRNSWLPLKFAQGFVKKRLRLQSGGQFEFDAVSTDGTIAVLISACGGVTSGGNKATSKLHKIRSDALFLLLVDAPRKILVFSCPRMRSLCEAEISSGRLPNSIEVLLAELPIELEIALAAARLSAAQEVSPQVLPHVVTLGMVSGAQDRTG